MTAKKGALSRGILASVGLAAVASLGFAGVAAAAVGPDQPGHDTAGSLTINKYKGNYTETPSDDDLLDGVEFKVQQVGILVEGTCTAINLTTSVGWDQAADFIPTDGSIKTTPPAPPYCLYGTVYTEETEGGRAVFEDLPLGLYYVQEGADNGGNNIVDPVQPFYVTIPMAVPPATGQQSGDYDWNYHPVVNPKNAVSEAPNKQVTDPQPEGQWVLGSQVEWTITNTIPTLNEGTFTEVSVTDPLDPRLSYVAGSTVFKLGTETLTEGADGDYVITDNLVWTLTDAGLAQADLHQGELLSVVFKTTVDSLTPNGVIPNKGTVSFNNKPQDTPEPISFWGGFSFVKVDESNSGKTLAGAEFAVTEKPADAACPTTLTAPIRGTATSTAAGVVSFPGLWISNWNPPAGENNPQVKTRDYCLYETKAPAGYEIPAGTFPKVVTVNAEAPNGTIDIGQIKNPQTKPPTLPTTGASGAMLMTIGGIAIVGLGVGAAMVARGRRQTQEV